MSKLSIHKRSLDKFFKKSYGLGINKSPFISKFLGFNSRLALDRRLSGKNIHSITKRIKYLFFGLSLKSLVKSTILFLIRIKSYKGMRHKSKNPARGQRTHTNGKTKKRMRY